jgi:hypothetical protein
MHISNLRRRSLWKLQAIRRECVEHASDPMDRWQQEDRDYKTVSAPAYTRV